MYNNFTHLPQFLRAKAATVFSAS